jgi:hypothetical protein
VGEAQARRATRTSARKKISDAACYNTRTPRQATNRLADGSAIIAGPLAREEDAAPSVASFADLRDPLFRSWCPLGRLPTIHHYSLATSAWRVACRPSHSPADASHGLEGKGRHAEGPEGHHAMHAGLVNRARTENGDDVEVFTRFIYPAELVCVGADRPRATGENPIPAWTRIALAVLHVQEVLSRPWTAVPKFARDRSIAINPAQRCPRRDSRTGTCAPRPYAEASRTTARSPARSRECEGARLPSVVTLDLPGVECCGRHQSGGGNPIPERSAQRIGGRSDLKAGTAGSGWRHEGRHLRARQHAGSEPETSSPEVGGVRPRLDGRGPWIAG